MAKTKVDYQDQICVVKFYSSTAWSVYLHKEERSNRSKMKAVKPAAKRKSEAGNLFKFGFTIKNDTGKYYPTDCSI